MAITSVKIKNESGKDEYVEGVTCPNREETELLGPKTLVQLQESLALDALLDQRVVIAVIGKDDGSRTEINTATALRQYFLREVARKLNASTSIKESDF